MGNKQPQNPSVTHLRCKLILLGDPQVGKTSLVRSLQYDYTDQDQGGSGCELTVHYFNLRGCPIKLLVMDSFTESDLNLECRLKSIKNCDVAAIVFDLTNQNSWRLVGEKLDWLSNYGYTKQRVCLIGTHKDMSEWQVTEEEIQSLIQENEQFQLDYFSVSTKERENIEPAFECCLEIGIGMHELRWNKVRNFAIVVSKAQEVESTSGYSIHNICEILPNMMRRRKPRGFPVQRLSNNMCKTIAEFL